MCKFLSNQTYTGRDPSTLPTVNETFRNLPRICNHKSIYKTCFPKTAPRPPPELYISTRFPPPRSKKSKNLTNSLKTQISIRHDHFSGPHPPMLTGCHWTRHSPIHTSADLTTHVGPEAQSRARRPECKAASRLMYSLTISSFLMALSMPSSSGGVSGSRSMES